MEERAKSFISVRSDHERELAEDYTELVLDLTEEVGQARIGDMAARLGVSHVAALRAVQRLKKQGYLVKETHGPVSLTGSGRLLALEARKKHEILYQVLLKLGVSPATAQLDVEGMEHHISPETLHAFESFLRKEDGEI